MVMSICDKYHNNTNKIWDCKRKDKKGCSGCEYHIYNPCTSANWDLDTLAHTVIKLMELDAKEKKKK